MSHITNSDYQRSVTHFMYFCTNFPSNFMDAFKNSPVKNHLQEKFNQCYKEHGAIGAMVKFFHELSKENQETLMYWVKVNYTGNPL